MINLLNRAVVDVNGQMDPKYSEFRLVKVFIGEFLCVWSMLAERINIHLSEKPRKIITTLFFVLFISVPWLFGFVGVFLSSVSWLRFIFDAGFIHEK